MDVDDMDDLDDLDDMGINMDGQVHLDDFRIHIMGPCDSFLISQVNDEDRVSDDDDKTDHLESSLGAAQISCQPKSGVS